MVLPRAPNYSLYPEEPFLVIRAKKEKTRASILTDNWCLWYALFPLLRKCFKKAPNLGVFQKKYEVKGVYDLENSCFFLNPSRGREDGSAHVVLELLSS